MASSHTTETAVPREDENAPLLNKQSTLANDRVVTKSSTNTDNKGYKRDQTKAAKVERRARRLFNAAGNNLSMEESRKQAFKEVTEARRIYAQRQRISMKEKGIKKNKPSKQGYGNKNESIARKIVAILKENNNGIYRYDIAKQKAEEWYSQSTCARSAKYRRNKKLLKEQKRQ